MSDETNAGLEVRAELIMLRAQLATLWANVLVQFSPDPDTTAASIGAEAAAAMRMPDDSERFDPLLFEAVAKHTETFFDGVREQMRNRSGPGPTS